MVGDFILECIIQLEGGVKKRSAVKLAIVGLPPGGCRIREEEKEKIGEGRERTADMLCWKEGKVRDGGRREIGTQYTMQVA